MPPLSELLVPGSASGVVVAIVYLILRGHLMTKRQVDEVFNSRDDWKALALRTQEQNSSLIEAVKIVEDVLNALPTVRRNGGGGGRR